jgi:hypothetical protein
MSFKDSLRDAADKIKHAAHDAAENVKDTFNEATHRSTAEAERAKRDLGGDDLTPSEFGGSVLNEAKNDLQADISATKRNLRENP